MSGWDYWRGTLEAASAQAQAAASQASKFAEVVSAQVSEQSKHIAAQASTYSSVAAQRATDAKAQAQAQLAGMHLPDALANLKLPADGDAEPPSPEELAVYGIDGDFCAFVRGLTYSTFRDFPPEELDRLMAEQEGSSGGGGGDDGGASSQAASDGDGGSSAPLNPWQAKHATLVCLAVKEMNELRFVLVPKRLRDEQFWAIYFTLTRGRLPPEAFDMLLQKQLEPPTVPKEPKAPLFKPDMIKPAAAAPESEDPGGKGQTWLRNLVCGFDMEIPAERLQQETIVLGALHNKFQQLSESAKNIHIPEQMRHNISANLGNVREFVGDFVPSARSGAAAAAGGDAGASSGAAGGSAGDVTSAAGAGAAAATEGASGAAPSMPEAVRGNGGGNGVHAAAAEASDAAQHRHAEDASALEAASLRHSADGSANSAQLDADPDLEAYLKEMAGSEHGGNGDAASEAGSAASLDDGEFDKYLAELSQSGAGGDGGSSDAGSGEEVELDLEEYMNAIASGDEAASDDGGKAADE